MCTRRRCGPTAATPKPRLPADSPVPRVLPWREAGISISPVPPGVRFTGRRCSPTEATGPGYATQAIALSGTGLTSDATRTTLRVSPNPVAVGFEITITATVEDTTTAATVPNGSVAFTDSVGGTVVSLNGGAAVPLSNGKAVLTVIPNVAGTHTITAHYSGIDDRFTGSTGEVSLIVQP